MTAFDGSDRSRTIIAKVLKGVECSIKNAFWSPRHPLTPQQPHLSLATFTSLRSWAMQLTLS